MPIFLLSSGKSLTDSARQNVEKYDIFDGFIDQQE